MTTANETTPPERITGGEAVVRALEMIGVTRVFCVASVHNLPILNAVSRTARIRTVNVRHEQAAVHAADGYSRVTGRLGVAVTSTGPGAANSMGGLFEAGSASSPVLMLTGQIETRFLGRQRGYLHEAENQHAMLAPVTRDAITVRNTAEIGEAVLQAARAALTGRPAPVAVEIPIDLQYATDRASVLEWQEPARMRPSDDSLAKAASVLSTARRPVIWCGGGVIRSGAWEAVGALADQLGAPVVTSVEGRGSLPETDPRCAGSLTASRAIRSLLDRADVMIAVGTRFTMYQTGFWRLRLPPLIHVDVDPTVFGRSYPAQVGVVGDARETLTLIARHLSQPAADPDWLTEAQAASRAARDAALDLLGPDHRAICHSIRRHLPDDGVVVRDATVPAYAWADQLLPIVRPRTSLRPVSAAIGPGLPLAIGAAVGSQSPVVLVQGDGGLMLSVGELATAAQYNAPIVMCLFNDHGYGVLRSIERATFDTPLHDVDLTTPDFTTLATAMGWESARVASAGEFDAVFAKAVAARSPYLIEVDMRALAPMSYPIGDGRPIYE